MCKPLYFSSLDYAINPWMSPGTIDEEKTMTQWNTLVNEYNNLGIAVITLDQAPHVPDMVFATDQAIVRDHKVLLSRFWHTERQSETKQYEAWFREHEYSVHHLPKDVYFEGNGDSYFWNDFLFVGVGYRADEKTCTAIAKIFDRQVIPLEIIDPAFYHLDVGLFPLNNETIFYYPPAFSEKSRGVLQKIVPNLIPFTREEAFGFCANSVVTDHHVVHQKENPTFSKKLHELGYKTVEVDLGEFKKSGGGAHCLTNILETAIEHN